MGIRRDVFELKRLAHITPAFTDGAKFMKTAFDLPFTADPLKRSKLINPMRKVAEDYLKLELKAKGSINRECRFLDVFAHTLHNAIRFKRGAAVKDAVKEFAQQTRTFGVEMHGTAKGVRQTTDRITKLRKDADDVDMVDLSKLETAQEAFDAEVKRIAALVEPSGFWTWFFPPEPLSDSVRKAMQDMAEWKLKQARRDGEADHSFIAKFVQGLASLSGFLETRSDLYTELSERAEGLATGLGDDNRWTKDQEWALVVLRKQILSLKQTMEAVVNGYYT